MPDLDVAGLDGRYKPIWVRLPFWKALFTAIRYGCRIRRAI